MAKDNFVERQSSPAIDSKSLCLLRFSTVSWQNASPSRGHRRMEKEDWVVYRDPSISWIGSNRRRVNGIRVETFPRIHSIADSRWDSEKWWTKCSVNLNISQVESSSCTEIKKNHVWRILKLWQDMQNDSRTDIGHFSDLDQKRNGTDFNTYKPNGEWDDVAEHMFLNFSESGHPVFRGTSALERGSLQSKGSWKLVRTLLESVEKAIRESSIRTRLGKSSTLRMLIRKPRKRTILVCVCGRYKTVWKETEHRPNVKNTYEIRWFGRTDIIPWPRLLGLHSKRISDKQRYCRQLQEHVRIQNLCWSKKATKYRETWREHFLMVPWYGRSCKEIRGKILRIGEQNNSTLIQKRKSMHGWSSI